MSEEEVVETPETPVETPPEPSWPEEWREMYAGEDEGKLSKLSRYASPTAALDAMIAAQNKISSGDYKSTAPFPIEGTEKEQTAWRKENGIPTEASKYTITQEIAKENKEVIDKYLAFAHSRNATPQQVQDTIDWFYAQQDAQNEEAATFDAEAETKFEDELRVDWGKDYRRNMNIIENYLDTAKEGVKESLWNARLDDGSLLRTNPDMMRFLVDSALKINPATTLVPGAGDNISGAITDEIKTIETLMANKQSEYWKGPKADGHQKRYRELLMAQEQHKKR